jgi:hypothetical protein
MSWHTESCPCQLLEIVNFYSKGHLSHKWRSKLRHSVGTNTPGEALEFPIQASWEKKASPRSRDLSPDGWICKYILRYKIYAERTVMQDVSRIKTNETTQDAGKNGSSIFLAG